MDNVKNDQYYDIDVHVVFEDKSQYDAHAVIHRVSDQECPEHITKSPAAIDVPM